MALQAQIRRLKKTVEEDEVMRSARRLNIFA